VEFNKGKIDTFGEAEKFICAVSKVNRYEPKLNCMIFIGTFEDTVKELLPVSPISLLYRFNLVDVQ